MDNVTINITEAPENVTVQITDTIQNVTVEVSELGTQGAIGPQGNIVEILAAENLTAFTVINGDGTIANSNIVNKRDKAIGITIETINNGFSGNAITFGFVENPLWSWNAGDILYLNGTLLSTINPSVGFSQIIAVAISATKIDLNIKNAILI